MLPFWPAVRTVWWPNLGVCSAECRIVPPCPAVRSLWKDCRVDRQSGTQLLTMMALVAAIVAMVILVFFGVGYLFGRLFL